MKTYVAILTSVLFTLIATTTLADGFTEIQMPTDVTAITMDGGVTTSLTEEWGLGVFFLVTRAWAEAYVGPSFSPTTWIQLCLQAGIQQAGDGVEPRFALSAWVGGGAFSMFSIVEFDLNGSDGLWYDMTPRWNATDWLDIGIKARRFVGIGPMVDVAIPTTPARVWVAWMPLDPESEKFTADQGLVGVALGF
jgi:hypothetical protein